MPESRKTDPSLPVLLAMSMQLGAAVAVPTVLLALGGHWLDLRYGTGIRWLVAGLALGFVLAMLFVWRIVQLAQERLRSMDPR